MPQTHSVQSCIISSYRMHSLLNKGRCNQTRL
uniref:Uncharacterized protein n=1 Tax=Anguilla anguilla TaxID=7936 RepID=A0A0E9VTY5_ANGAN